MRKVHQTLKRITNDFEVRWHFNTSVSLLMDAGERDSCAGAVGRRAESNDPEARPGNAAPDAFADGAAHLRKSCGRCWGIRPSLARENWPQYREDLAREEQFEVIIQINGRLRGKILVEDDLSEEETLNRALTDPRIAILIAGKEILKTIVVPRKLVNIVLR